VAFWYLIRPGTLTRRVCAVIAAVVVSEVVWMNVVTVTINDSLPRDFVGFLGVGINEETSKALPVLVAALVLLKVKNVKWDVRMWMFIGTVSGLTFGVVESMIYTAEAILTVNHDPGRVIVGVLLFAERVFVDGFQHAVWAGISGFFIGMGVNYPRRRAQLIIFGIGLPALLHALNDTLANSGTSLLPVIIIQGVSLFLFLGYTMSSTAIEKVVRSSPIFRGQSILLDAPSGLAAPPDGH
jgi:RsiW-degrading membrane proteinase PrsW (M82 family)